MPFIKVRTNVDIDKSQVNKLMTELSQLLASETGKPERYVMVEVQGSKDMMFGGSVEPLAYLECKSIGLSTAQVKLLSPAISKLIGGELQVNSERVYIEFSNCSAEFWGWNGSTFG